MGVAGVVPEIADVEGGGDSGARTGAGGEAVSTVFVLAQKGIPTKAETQIVEAMITNRGRFMGRDQAAHPKAGVWPIRLRRRHHPWKDQLWFMDGV
jgi:hypothetical protein